MKVVDWAMLNEVLLGLLYVLLSLGKNAVTLGL